MSSYLATKYVKLTETISVPDEWPVDVLREFLVPLVEQVIIAANAGKSVVLQVMNQPAMWVQRQNRSGRQNLFEKVFTKELMSSHVIDVIFNTSDKNIQALKDVTMPDSDPNSYKRRLSLDDYNVQVCQSEYRTTYYLMPVAQTVPIPRPVQTQEDGWRPLKTSSGSTTNRDVTFLLAAVGIPPLLFIILLIQTYVN